MSDTDPGGGSQELLESLADEANDEHRKAIGAMRQALDHARASGEALIEAKGQLEHGDWTPWLEENFEASARTARIYMRIARNWPELAAKRQRSAGLSIDAAISFLSESRDEADGEATADAEDPPPGPGGIVRREDLARHLELLHLRGTINAARLEANYSAFAQTPESDLGVIIPPLGRCEALPVHAPVLDLGLLIRALRGGWRGASSGPTHAKMDIRDQVLTVVHEGIRVSTTLFDFAETELRAETLERWDELVEAAPEVYLGDELVFRFLTLHQVLKAELVNISIRPDDPEGSCMRLYPKRDGKGIGTLHFVARGYERPIEVCVNAQLLAAVFRESNPLYWSMRFSDHHVGISGGEHALSGEYRYVLTA